MWALLLIDRWGKQNLPQALRFFTNFGRRYVPPGEARLGDPSDYAR